MNREIKFRVWNHTEGKWNGSYHKEAKMVGELCCKNGIYIIPESVSRHQTAEQYTGLKDKNGVDIYEGDIVLFEHWDSPKHELEKYLCSGPKKIVWGLNHGQFPTAGWCAINPEPADLEEGHQLNHMDQRNMVAVGNIHEGNFKDNAEFPKPKNMG